MITIIIIVIISTDGIIIVFFYYILINNKIQENSCTLMRITIQNAAKHNAAMHYNSMIQTLQCMCMHKGFKESENCSDHQITPDDVQTLQAMGLIFISIKERECHAPLRIIE